MKNYYLILITSCFIFSYSTSFSQAAWHGNINSDWANDLNWVLGSAPAEGEAVLIDKLAYFPNDDPTISTPYTNSIGNLIVSNGGILNIAADLTGDGLAITSINLLTGGVINHSNGTVSGFDDLLISSATFNLTGGDMYIEDDTQFIGINGTINISDGLLAVGVGIIDTGILDLEGYLGNKINITGGRMEVEEVSNPGLDTEINVTASGTMTVADNEVFTVLDGQIIALTDGQMISEDVIINPGGIVNIDPGATVTVTGNVLNNGVLTAGANSTLELDGIAQKIFGNSTATIANVEIGNTAGTTVSLETDVDVSGDLSINTVNGSSIIPNTSTMTFNGTTPQSIFSPATFYDLVVDNSAGLTLSGTADATVTNDLSLTDGILTTDANLLILCDGSASATITGGSSTSFINGNLNRCMDDASYYDFPIGTGTIYKRAGITPDAATETSYTISAVEGGSDASNINTDDLNNVSTLEHWNITGSEAAKVRLYWNTPAESGISDASELSLGHYTGGTPQWEEVVATYIALNDYIESTASVSSFGSFTFASSTSSDNILPVTWLNFEGRYVGGKAELTWSTAAEIDNAGFYIEKSFNNIAWEAVGFVSGNGTINEISKYRFVDFQNPLRYYRIRQEDTDGTVNYSKIVEVEGVFENTQFLVKDGSQLSLMLQNFPKTEGELQIYNLQGDLLWDQALVLEDGSNEVGYCLLNSGQLLILHFRIGEEMKSYKILD